MRAAAAIALAGWLLGGSAFAAEDLVVKVRRDGATVVMDVEADVPGTVAEAWAVMTDYDHMASFISNVKQSKVIARRGDLLEVSQAGATRVGFWTFDFAMVRTVELVPQREIRSALVSGDFTSYTSTTNIGATAGGVHISHHGEYVPKRWLPPLIGTAVIESEAKKQYKEFLAEIDRRSAAARSRRDQGP